MNAIVLAHGLGGRSDLPVPLWLALYGGAAAVLVSFAALGAFWRDPKLQGAGRPRAMPQVIESVVDSVVTRTLLRALGVLLWAFTIATAAFGSDSDAFNPAPTLLYVWFWVGLVPLSLLFGPVWRLMNPLRAISALVNRLTPRYGGETELPTTMGYWPAAVGLSVFVWLELVYDKASEPSTVLAFVLIYSVVQVAAANIYGMDWYSRGDGFEVYSTLLAGFSVFARNHEGRLALRNPFRGLASLKAEPGLVAVVAVLLGSTAFDGLTRTHYWTELSQGRTGATYLLLGTVGLLVAVGFVVLTYMAAMRVTAGLVGPEEKEKLAGAFIHSLIPIAVGYTVAHYFSLFVFQGQAGYILSTDPFGTGADLLGTKGWAIDYLLVSTAAIALVQVGAIVLGHVAGVVSAHDRALEIFPGRDRARAQYPLLVVMVLYTVGGISLLVGT